MNSAVHRALVTHLHPVAILFLHAHFPAVRMQCHYTDFHWIEALLRFYLSHRQYDEGENEANGEAVIVDRVFPWLHGVVLKAHRLVPACLAQLFVVEEHDTHRDLFQPDDRANEPGGTHRAERGEPATKDEKQVRGSRWRRSKTVAPDNYFKGWTTAR